MLLPGTLREEAGGAKRLDVELADGATLGDALDQVGTTHPRLHRRLRDERGGLRRYVNFYVDGEECRQLSELSTVLRGGAEVRIIPSIAGG